MTASQTVPDPMMAPVQNPQIIFQSAPLPAPMRERLHALGYAPHATELLMQGLPITYNEGHRQIVEYPDGRRVWVSYDKVYADSGEFLRYQYRILGELEPAPR